MGSYSLITDPESIRSNQNGQVTKDQYQSIKDRFSSLPGCVSVGVLFAIIGLVGFLGEKTLTRSTPLAILALFGVILGTFTILAVLGSLVARLRMTRIAVERLSGQIVWARGGYTAMAGGRPLLPVTGSLDLPPGDYTFYRLAGTSYLLSAQPAGAAPIPAAEPSAGMELAALKALLDQPLDFDPRTEPARAADRLVQLQEAAKNLPDSLAGHANPQETAELVRRVMAQIKLLVQGQDIPNLIGLVSEAQAAPAPTLDQAGLLQLTRALEQTGARHPAALSANAAGRQTSGQRAALLRETTSNLAWAAVFGIGWLVLSYLFIIRANWSGLLATSAILLLALVMTLSGVRKELSDLLSGSVQVEEGWVTKSSRTSHTDRSSYTHYFCHVNQASLEISQFTYNALIEGNYRVCFLPGTHNLVNIDPMQDFST